MSRIGTCALCSQSKELLDSHIVSKWTYRRVLGYEPNAAPAPVQVFDGKSVLTSKQVTQHLLCADCEQRLSTWENYASKVGLQADGAFPARDAVKVVATEGNLKVAESGGLEVDMLTLFAVSVFWRADVAQIEPIVNLGKARDPIRNYLLGRVGFPADSNLFVRLLVPPSGSPRIDRIVAFPATTSESGVERHDFTACGMSFTLYAGGEVPGALYKFSFPQKRMVLLSDGRALLESVAREVTASRAAGSLAERH